MPKKDPLQNMLKELDSLIKEERSKTANHKPLIETENQPIDETPPASDTNQIYKESKDSTKAEDYANFFRGSKPSKRDDYSTPLNQRYATHEDLQKNYTEFLTRIQNHLSTLGGGGSYELMDNRDVVRRKASMLDDRSILIFNQAIQKFEPKTLSDSLLEIEHITSSTEIGSFESSEKFVGVNSATPATLDLAGSFSDGQKLIIKDKSGNSSVNNITIESADLIDDQASVLIAINWGSVTLFRNNNTWSII